MRAARALTDNATMYWLWLKRKRSYGHLILPLTQWLSITYTHRSQAISQLFPYLAQISCKTGFNSKYSNASSLCFSPFVYDSILFRKMILHLTISHFSANQSKLCAVCLLFVLSFEIALFSIKPNAITQNKCNKRALFWSHSLRILLTQGIDLNLFIICLETSYLRKNVQSICMCVCVCLCVSHDSSFNNWLFTISGIDSLARTVYQSDTRRRAQATPLRHLLCQ